MTQPTTLIDLYCGEGGAARGYIAAGFKVLGVDADPKVGRRYPGDFLCADVLALPVSLLAMFDAIHASPPCQFATPLRHAPGGKEHPNLIPGTRKLLEASGRPYVIENVEEAAEHMIDPVMFCGRMFNLGVRDHGVWFHLERHRLFETNWGLRPQHHPTHYGPVVGVYGGHARNRSAEHGGRKTRDVWEGGHRTAAAKAMGVRVDEMTLDGLSEAIPPIYALWVGEQLLTHLGRLRAAPLASVTSMTPAWDRSNGGWEHRDGELHAT